MHHAGDPPLRSVFAHSLASRIGLLFSFMYDTLEISSLGVGPVAGGAAVGAATTVILS